MSPRDASAFETAGGHEAAPAVSPSVNALRWLLGLRIVVISTLFLGILLIQGSSEQILPLQHFYEVILSTYGLSLAYIVVYALRLPLRLQIIMQLVGDICVITTLVYFTGGIYSPFSFLYLTVIVSGAITLRGGGPIFAGLSAVAYGGLIDLIVFKVLKTPPNLGGATGLPPIPRILSQLMIHVVGFVLVAILVSYLADNLRKARIRLMEVQERSRKLEAVTQHVVRSVNAGIIATDLGGHILHINPAARRILSPPDDADEITHVLPLKNRSLKSSLARVRSTASPVRFNAHHQLTGQSLGLTIGPLEGDAGDIVGFIFNFQDLSQVEAIQDEQLRQERMAAVGEMASRMAHEIKNPLAGISGSAQMLASTGGLGEREHHLLQILVDESQRLSKILDNYLDYSRTEVLEPTVCDLSAILRECMELLRTSKELHPDHHLKFHGPEKAPILAHEHLLRQIFWNLARNALAAMPEGGSLKIELEDLPGKFVLLFRDTGRGMPDKIRHQAFEPFVSYRPGGTGLGLAIVYNAVERHEGRVEIESSSGQGTTVRVELPQRLHEEGP